MDISTTRNNSLKAQLIATSMRSIAAVTSQCAICSAGKYNGEEITVAVQEKHVPYIYIRVRMCARVCFRGKGYAYFL